MMVEADMATRNRELMCLIGDEVAGRLWQDEAGLAHFAYEESYDGIPLSLSLPVSNRTYRQTEVVPYLMGLLPDSAEVRRDAAREFGVSPNNPVAMLAHMGLDCPGGVQFCWPDHKAEVLDRQGSYAPLSDADIADRLRMLRVDSSASWVAEDEHWSLGGNQGKFALAWHKGAWCSCEGAAATTHIFKNGVIGFALQALNEFVCMRLADACGLPTADVAYRAFEDEPALIVSRYDRTASPDGTIRRLHQEDFCQALGVPPSQKYTADGGPTVADCIKLLASTKEAELNILAFTQMLFFNCLIGAPDAHAKNYSLLLGRGRDALVAPMYDVASGLAYEGMRRKGRLAMAIGGENCFARVGRGAVKTYAAVAHEACEGVTEETCLAIMSRLAKEIPGRLASVFDEYASVPGMDELRSHLEQPVVENCEATLRLL